MGRLNRAGRLTSALADEEVRWGQIVKDLTAELWAIPGDVLIASAYVAYLGAFPVQYRKDLTSHWAIKCKTLNIPSSPEFKLVNCGLVFLRNMLLLEVCFQISLVAVLGEAYEIRNWNMNFLPRDEVSIENGIVVTKALRWPLMIDPQEQVRVIVGQLNINVNVIFLGQSLDS